MRDATALVTGGAGFIGSHLTDRLIAEGARVRVLSDLSTGCRENLKYARGRVELIEGSVTDSSVCEAACRGVEYVFRQAAVPSVQRSVADQTLTHEVAATGTLRMLIAARGAGVRRFVYGGSSSAYGDTPTLPKREDIAERPLSPYARARAWARGGGAALLQRVRAAPGPELPVFGGDPSVHCDGTGGMFSHDKWGR